MLTPVGRMVRLILHDRLNNTQIATQTGLARNTVSAWRQRIKDKELSEDDFEGLNDAEIRKLVTPGLLSKKGTFFEPDFAVVRFEKEERDVSIELLHQEYLDKVPIGQKGMSITKFYRDYAAFTQAASPELHFTYAAGEMIQHDFVGNKRRKRPVLYSSTGVQRDYEVGCAISAISQKIFVQVLESQSKAPFFEYLSDLFEFYGGVPLLLTLDNFKAAIKEPRRSADPAVPTAEMQEIADHYQFGLVAARVRKPRDKGLVENAVGITQNQILAPLRNRCFHSIDELNAAIQERLEILNSKPMKTHANESRNKRFNRLDQSGFQPLPRNRYEYGTWQLSLRVGKDYHVHVDGHRYSVPSRLFGELVDVKQTFHSIRIYYGGQIVATHQRDETGRERTTSLFHMPPNHQQASLLRLEGAKAAVREVGENAVQLIDNHYRRHKKPSETANAAVKLIQLANQHSVDDVDAACQKAVLLGIPNPRKVEEIINAGLQTFLPDESSVTEAPTPSGNVRGRQYFSDILKFKRKDRNHG